MSLENRVEILEKESRPEEQETIIPQYRTPDTYVFCADRYDNVFYFIYRAAYNCEKDKEYGRQDKKTCIHNTDDSLKHSLRSAGFMCSAINGNELKYYEIIKICKDKWKREKLLKEKYEREKKYTSACDLYLPETSGVTKQILDIENEIPIQNKIVLNKFKIYYDKAIEVLSNFD